MDTPPPINQSKSQAMYEPDATLNPLVTLTFAEWKDKYQPGGRLPIKGVSGFIGKAEADRVEEAVQAALAKDARLVWTELDTGKRRVIVNGWCFVNRTAYWITAVPADSMLDDIEVPLD
jgi:hypothetical protein